MKYRKGNPNSLDKKKVKGKIVVCVGSTEEKYGTDLKIAIVKEAGVINYCIFAYNLKQNIGNNSTDSYSIGL